MKEEWWDIPEFPDYRVSNFGRVISRNNKKRKSDKEMTPVLNKNRGYYYISVQSSDSKKRKNFILHRLVARLFIPNEWGKEEVNHKDGNKQNNRADNLEWCTRKENVQHALKTGLMRTMDKNEGRLKYSNDECLTVIKRVKGGMSYKKAGEICRMPYSTVAHLMRGSRRQILTKVENGGSL